MVSSGLRDLAITIGFGFSPLSSIPPNPINNRDSQTLCRLSRKQIRKVAKANVPHKNKFACHKLHYLVQFDRYLDCLLYSQITQNHQWRRQHNPTWKREKQGDNRGSNFQVVIYRHFTHNLSVFDTYFYIFYCSVLGDSVANHRILHLVQACNFWIITYTRLYEFICDKKTSTEKRYKKHILQRNT